MNGIATLLRKDLREQRLTLLAPWALGALASLGVALLVDASWLDTPVFAQVLALTLGSLCALAIGCDLGSRERGEGSLPWLLRQPFGFGTVIASKLLVLLLGMLLGLGAGALFAQGTSAAVAAGQATFGLGRTEGILVLVVVSLGLWSTSASTWMPRGFLAAPAGLVSFVLVAAPAWVPIVWYELRPDRAVWASLAIAAPLGGLLAAIAGLASGVRGAGGPARRAGHALGAGVLGCLPLWLAAARQTQDVLHFDPTSEPFEIRAAYLAPDGRSVLLDTWEGRVDWRRRPVDGRPIAVDLESGAWRELGPRGSQLRAVPSVQRPEYLLLEDASGTLAVLGMDGTPIAVEELPLSPGLEAPLIAPRGLRLHWPAGLGWSVRSATGPAYEGFFDPHVGAVFSLVDLRELGLDNARWHVLGTGGPWLLTDDRPERAGGARHVLYNAARRELSTPEWLREVRQVLGVLRDGRVLARVEEESGSHLVLLDTATGAHTRLPLLGGPALALESAHQLGSPSSFLDSPGWPTLLIARMAGERGGLLWLQLDAQGGPHLLWSDCPAGPFNPVGELGPRELLLVRDGALWTHSFAEESARRLFPR